MVRESRKLEHIKYSLELEDGPLPNGFADFTLIHNCLPDLSWKEIDISTNISGIRLNNPIIINAITGGASDVTKINADLAKLAYETDMAMAVGSQYAALENPEVESSYKIVRKYNPDGIVFANLGAHVNPKQAQRAIDMIGANAIQLHLNAAQEIIMSEGDRDFSGYLKNISLIADQINVPVIVKEVGCGIAREQARQLFDAGVKVIDTGGMGGTNFVAIESARNSSPVRHETLEWGIPTAISAVEIASVLSSKDAFVVSGGIRTPLETVKALALGASAVGIAGLILKRLKNSGLSETRNWLCEFLIDVRRFMLLTGSKTIQEIHNVPLIVTGHSREWLTARGIDIVSYAVKKEHG